MVAAKPAADAKTPAPSTDQPAGDGKGADSNADKPAVDKDAVVTQPAAAPVVTTAVAAAVAAVINPASPAGAAATSSEPAVPPASAPAIDPNAAAKLALAQAATAQAAGGSDKPADQLAEASPAGSHHVAPDPAVPAPDALTATPKATADAVQQASLTPPSPDATPAAATPAAPPAPTAAAVPLAGLAVDIAGKALAGKSRFDIRLDPPELGRIEVRLAVDKDGRITSHVIADRAATLDLLRSDANDLQRALQDAGLKTADNGLQFSLRDQGGRDYGATPPPVSTQIVVRDETLSDVNPSSYPVRPGLGGGLDIRV